MPIAPDWVETPAEVARLLWVTAVDCQPDGDIRDAAAAVLALPYETRVRALSALGAWIGILAEFIAEDQPHVSVAHLVSTVVESGIPGIRVPT